MWQRIQTVYLALGIACLGLMYGLPLARYTVGTGMAAFTFYVSGSKDASGAVVDLPSPMVPLHLLAGVGMVILGLVIFFYRDRKRQRRLIAMVYLLLLGLFAGVFMAEHAMGVLLGERGPVVTRYGFAYGSPLLALICTWLADRAIKKDEALVRSVDRLR
jgi:vacuolar-type H+-ATPase subunit I/STV1